MATKCAPERSLGATSKVLRVLLERCSHILATSRSRQFAALALIGLAALGWACGPDPIERNADSADSDQTTEDSGSATSDDPDLTSTDAESDGESDFDTDSESGRDDESSTDASSTDGDDVDTNDSSGGPCTADNECSSGHCYVVQFFGGQCGECTSDADCTDGGCTPPNPYADDGPLCNVGEHGGGCESDAVCEDGLECGNVFSLLGIVNIDTCGICDESDDCDPELICAPLFDPMAFTGTNECITPATLGQHEFCDLNGNGDQACASGICSTVDIMGLAQVGACGECDVDADCGGGTCLVGAFSLDDGTLTGSVCD